MIEVDDLDTAPEDTDGVLVSDDELEVEDEEELGAEEDATAGVGVGDATWGVVLVATNAISVELPALS